MTDAITGLTGSVGSYGTAPTAGTSSTALDKDTFLKLLVAQMKYQDPTKPADVSQFLAETAQFTLVEKFEEVSALNTELLATSRAASAVSLVGREVSWTAADGSSASGIVTGVSVSGGQPVLEVGDLQLTLDEVIRVRSAA